MSSTGSPEAEETIGSQRRSAILQAAEYLIALHGYDALRLRDVAKKAGVSIGMIQHYFVTRDDLLRETVRSANAQRIAYWSVLGSGHASPEERLNALLEGSVRDHHRCIVWVETCAASTRHHELIDDVQRTQNAWRATLHEVIDAGVKSGVFKPREPLETVVGLLVSLIDGLMLGIATHSAAEQGKSLPEQTLTRVASELLGL